MVLQDSDLMRNDGDRRNRLRKIRRPVAAVSMAATAGGSSTAKVGPSFSFPRSSSIVCLFTLFSLLDPGVRITQDYSLPFKQTRSAV